MKKKMLTNTNAIVKNGSISRVYQRNYIIVLLIIENIICFITSRFDNILGETFSE